MPTDKALRARIPGTWLVTGAAEFIGSNLLEALLELDQRVIGLDNFATGKRRISSRSSAPSAVRGGAACTSSKATSALGGVPQSIDDPLAYHASNVTGFLNLRLAARDADVSRFVYAGSSATNSSLNARTYWRDLARAAVIARPTFGR
jgi:UDP-N-acetylglucosamine 4-epimerase